MSPRVPQVDTLLIPKRFRMRRGLTSSIDLGNVNRSRFPAFERARRHECRLERGSCIHVPFLWWHRVQSTPGAENVALNFFFEADHESKRAELQAEHEALEASMEYLLRTGPVAVASGSSRDEL